MLYGADQIVCLSLSLSFVLTTEDNKNILSLKHESQLVNIVSISCNVNHICLLFLISFLEIQINLCCKQLQVLHRTTVIFPTLVLGN